MSEHITIPDDLLYTKEHEWVKAAAGVLRIGITDFAQHELGDIIHVELPAAGKAVSTGEAAAEIESVKSVSSVYAPADGEIVGVHEGLDPVQVNSDPYGEGWLFDLKAPVPEGLLSPADYRKHIGLD